MIVVYLSNRYIRVVEGEFSGGKINVRNLYYTADTKGCILNGTITDADGFLEVIRNLWESNHLPKKGVSLVIDSTQFTTKVTTVPVRKPKQMMEYVSREFTDVGRIADPVYGYFQIAGTALQQNSKAKIQTLFATTASRAYIQEFQILFGRLGITIDSVDSAIGTMIRLIQSLPKGRDHACMIQCIEDITLINVLMINGTYIYSSRNRLYSDSGTPGVSVEVARAVSNILQFVKAQNMEVKVEKIYVAGLAEVDFAIYTDSIIQIDTALEVERYMADSELRVEKAAGGEQPVSNFALAFGGLLKTDYKTNMMSQVVKDPVKEAQRKKRRKVVVPIAILAGVMAAITVVLGGWTLYLSMQLKDVREYNERPDVVEACLEYDTLKNELQLMNRLNSGMTGLKTNVLSYPSVDGSVEQVLNQCAAGLVTAEISSYDSSDGALVFKSSAANVDQINRFIALLMEQEIFAGVDYTGYTQDSDGRWNVKVNCTMAARQEDENDNDIDG